MTNPETARKTADPLLFDIHLSLSRAQLGWMAAALVAFLGIAYVGPAYASASASSRAAARRAGQRLRQLGGGRIS